MFILKNGRLRPATPQRQNHFMTYMLSSGRYRELIVDEHLLARDIPGRGRVEMLVNTHFNGHPPPDGPWCTNLSFEQRISHHTSLGNAKRWHHSYVSQMEAEGWQLVER